ncbi:putative membrane protein [Acinetobacter sp. 1294243]|jgi:hypothetical protein|uniref:hypothetical protein n=1 Tax=Acinetobacter baumannii TaxID=470 RepID=UPI00028341C3|nr:hypothetical protein [Acinetobacter baumannii]EKA68739.1 hypothetical protein ACINWC692_A0043 [Acinetobacter baumannii WC-692]EXR36005.1 putative membrane protein [Acinetobacter sp. 1294243]MCW1515211.1 hypothetical protein [Acinetobacter baumannii]
MIHIDYPVIILFTALMYWPVTLIVLATLIAISYSYREHSIAKYLMFFFIAVLIILSGAALYIALLL